MEKPQKSRKSLKPVEQPPDTVKSEDAVKRPGISAKGEQDQTSHIVESALVSLAYRTDLGHMLVGQIEDTLDHSSLAEVRARVNLVFTLSRS